ncbi:hypothetical protein COCNU_07G013290 [Cocos nucifera]|uniref:Uncharacterized protein n=1 Tax=Cocos nucifera TaxID=13894 RepID=A0A8K0IGS8_COCNU|nr:hypothetical protein COCNU_07G013290 [Cocos nucifera]
MKSSRGSFRRKAERSSAQVRLNSTTKLIIGMKFGGSKAELPRKLIIGMKFGSSEAELSFEAHDQAKFGASKGGTKFSRGMKFGIK